MIEKSLGSSFEVIPERMTRLKRLWDVGGAYLKDCVIIYVKMNKYIQVNSMSHFSNIGHFDPVSLPRICHSFDSPPCRTLTDLASFPAVSSVEDA